MCHVLLLLPLLALPVFWLFPLSVALPAYGAVAVLAAAIYWSAMQAMNQPILNGAEGMIGKICEVIDNRDGALLVGVDNQIWHAARVEPWPRRGDRLKVVGVEDLTLRLQELS